MQGVCLLECLQVQLVALQLLCHPMASILVAQVENFKAFYSKVTGSQVKSSSTKERIST